MGHFAVPSITLREYRTGKCQARRLERDKGRANVPYDKLLNALCKTTQGIVEGLDQAPVATGVQPSQLAGGAAPV